MNTKQFEHLLSKEYKANITRDDGKIFENVFMATNPEEWAITFSEDDGETLLVFPKSRVLLLELFSVEK